MKQLACAAALALCLTGPVMAQTQDYLAEDVGSITSISPRVTDVNSAGQFVSVHATEGGPFGFMQQAMITDPNGDTRLVGPIAPYIGQGNDSWGGVLLINDAGQVAGTRASIGGTSTPRGFFVNADGTTSAIVNGSEDVRVLGMNGAGIVWGLAARNGDQWFQGFFTGPNGTGMNWFGDASRCALPTESCGIFSRATDVNVLGQAIGRADGQSFITGVNGQGLFSLGSLAISLLPQGATLTAALDIDDAGRILAQASNGRNYVLTPVPEPSSYALMLVGLAALGVARRRARAMAIKSAPASPTPPPRCPAA